MKKKDIPQPTVEEIEKKYNIKITYPSTYLKGEWSDEDINQIKRVGCIDLNYTDVETKHYNWLHQDCWGWQTDCKDCAFKEFRDKYHTDNNISNDMEPDLIKAGFVSNETDQNMMDFFSNMFKKE